MSIAWLDGMKKNARVSQVVEEAINEAGEGFSHLQLEKMNLQPCRNCGGCNYRTPGQCVAKDETAVLMKEVVHSDRFMILTAISFGSYSSTVKKAMDKLALIGLPVFINYKGRLQHPHRYEVNSKLPNLVVAVTDHNTDHEKSCFEKLVKANGTIMMSDLRLLFIDIDEPEESIKEKLSKFLKEVSA